MRRGESCSNIIDITKISDLQVISEQGGLITIGAASTHKVISTHTIIKSQASSLSYSMWLGWFPGYQEHGNYWGKSRQCFPCSRFPCTALIHDAIVVLESKDGTRRMKVEDFILAPYKTAIDARELLTLIQIKGLTGYREGYKRVTKRAAWADIKTLHCLGNQGRGRVIQGCQTRHRLMYSHAFQAAGNREVASGKSQER